MTTPSKHVLDYYTGQGPLSDIGKYTVGVQKLSDDPAKLSEVVQGLILHDMWIDRYKVTPQSGQWCSAMTPSMEDLLDTTVAINKAEPFNHREPGERVIACCREFSTMLCGILRAKGVPARARCGFAPYMEVEGRYGDHWMCEFWDGEAWQRVDPQIDAFQLKTIKDYAQKHDKLGDEYRTMLLGLDPLHLKPTDFMLAGEAWQKCLNNELDPDTFGLDTAYGLWFVRGNLVRDFLALNRIELLPFVEGLEKAKTYWNEWPIMLPDTPVKDKERKMLDRVAELTLDPDNNFDAIQKLYAVTSELHPPESILAKS